MKIDTESHEISVLNGMRKTVQKSHPTVVIETHNDSNRGPIRRLLAKCGYDAKDLLTSGQIYMVASPSHSADHGPVLGSDN